MSEDLFDSVWDSVWDMVLFSFIGFGLITFVLQV
jgi:hypothetical protein